MPKAGLAQNVARVAANMIMVHPTCHTKECIKQPPYVRSKHTYAGSAALLAFRSCIQGTLKGTSGTQADIRANFTRAAKKCSGKAV